MKQLITLLAVVVMVSSAARADDKKYTLADLKALVASKSYQEAVVHLGDISPSERSAAWLDIAAEAASGYLAGLSNDDLVTKVLSIEEIDGRYPQLLKSAKYTKVRADIGLKGYEACFAASYTLEECLQHAMKFIDADGGNADLAFRMSKLVRKSGNAYNAVPYFKKALAGKPSAAMCKDEDVKLAVVAGLGLPTDYDGAKGAREISVGACWDALKKPIIEAFIAEPSGYTHDNGCAVLKAKSALTADQAKTCK
jgi:hypothetical protein